MTATPQTEAISAPASLLEANLRALGKLNRDLAASLAEVEPYGPEEMEFVQTDEGVASARLQGRWLASRRRPLADVPALVEKANVREKPITVILGFGVGHHVKAICAEMGAKGAVLVFEPDLRLLRSVFEHVDCRWIGRSNLVFYTDAEDGSALSLSLRGKDAYVAQGVQFVEHAPSIARLGEAAKQFAQTFTRYVSATRLSVQTTLVQMHATARNILANLKHYVGGEGVAELRGCCAGHPAVVVSAGPSLQKNIELLSRPEVRERCVIVAVQTVLKPLLERGIRPHFITALDYHEISKRFYEGLTAEDVRGVQLVAEAKSNPAILDAFPGPIRNCNDPLATLVLKGALDRDMGRLPAGATVAHLAFYLAQHLGCDPIVFVGQDLGFTDGLYYGGRNPIHEVWGPELNPFRTLEMLEWERIRRTRPTKREDQEGRSILIDEQMATYLDQFERDFANSPQRIIDATEGGTRKRGADVMTLAEALEACPDAPLPEIPLAPIELDAERREKAAKHVHKVREEVLELKQLSKETATLLEKMLAEFEDRPRLERHFRKLEKLKAEVKKRQRAFTIVEILNQAGTFRRLRADRAIAMEKDLPTIEKQRRQIERDVPNVAWIRDAAQIMADLLKLCEDRLRDVPLPPESYTRPPAALGDGKGVPAKSKTKLSVAAVVPVAEVQLDHLSERPLRVNGDERTLLELTLARLCRCRHLTSIVLLSDAPETLEGLIDRTNLSLDVHVVATQGDPCGPKAGAIRAARAFSPTCWRGGLAGLTVYDELIAAQETLAALDARELSAALVVGADWALLDPALCDRLIEQYWVQPERFALVFTQAPPGLSGVLLGRPVLEQLAETHSLATLGSMLGYLPAKPQGDPIAKDNCLQVEQRVRQSLESAALSTPERIARCAPMLQGDDAASALEVVEHLEAQSAQQPRAWPQHLVVELCTNRRTHGPGAVPDRRAGDEPVERPAADPALLERLLEQLPPGAAPALTFAGVGDPLLHARWPDFVRLATERGLRLHVQTDLHVERDALDELLQARVDVISVNISAQRAATYEQTMGADNFRDVLEGIDYVRARQRQFAGLTLPWVVPRLVRCDATYEDIEGFYDKWLLLTQTALIEPMPDFSPYAGEQRLQPVPVPEAVRQAERRRTLYIRCDGAAVSEPADLYGDERLLGKVSDAPLGELWRRHCEAAHNG